MPKPPTRRRGKRSRVSSQDLGADEKKIKSDGINDAIIGEWKRELEGVRAGDPILALFLPGVGCRALLKTHVDALRPLYDHYLSDTSYASMFQQACEGPKRDQISRLMILHGICIFPEVRERFWLDTPEERRAGVRKWLDCTMPKKWARWSREGVYGNARDFMADALTAYLQDTPPTKILPK